MRLFVILFLLLNVANGKEKLSVLTLLPFSPNGQVAQVACNEALKIVIENVNNRDDILKDYELVQTIANEGPTATLANVEFVNFVRKAEENNETISPAAFGPTIACHFSGLTAKMLGFVTFSSKCHGPYIADRRKGYRLFPMQAPAVDVLHGMLAFITEIGKWSEISIVTLRSNPNLYMLAEYLERMATKKNVDVLLYSNEYNFTLKSMTALKDSGARIHAVFIVARHLCAQFMCLAHRAGLRPPSHVFLFLLFNCLMEDISDVPRPDGCTDEMLKEQLSTSFGVGGSLEYIPTGNVTENQIISSLGYGYESFQQRFVEKTKGMQVADYSTRLLCHDSMMVLTMALNRTDHILRTNFNKTLLNFKDDSEMIQELLAKSVMEQKYVTLRNGPVEFNTNGDISELYLAGQLVNGSMRYLFRSKVGQGSSSTSLLDKDIDFQIMSEPIWAGLNGKIPKDLSHV